MVICDHRKRSRKWKKEEEEMEDEVEETGDEETGQQQYIKCYHFMVFQPLWIFWLFSLSCRHSFVHSYSVTLYFQHFNHKLTAKVSIPNFLEIFCFYDFLFLLFFFLLLIFGWCDVGWNACSKWFHQSFAYNFLFELMQM